MDAAERDAWRMESFASSYRAWLLDRMDADEYGILFDLMYSVEYKWPDDIPRDEDRSAAGQDLRLEFEHQTGTECDPEWVEWPCSFLEMVIGLAKSMEDHILYDGSKGDRSAEWFWMMMSNIGLDIFNDNELRRLGKRGERLVNNAIKTVLDRRYDRRGNGGLFPLREPSEDQRNVEIWYQANAYILENGIE